MRDLYHRRNPHPRARGNPNESVPSETSMRKFLEDLAMEQHRSGFLSASPQIHQWSAHSVRYIISQVLLRYCLWY